MHTTDPAEPTEHDDVPAPEGPVVVASSTPEDLLALAAHTLGFWPSESLVMISLRGARLRSGLVARVDLDLFTDAAAQPSPDGGHGDVEQLVGQLLPAMVADGARAVAVLLCTDVDHVGVAHAAVVASAERVVTAHGLRLVDAVLIGAERRWSLTCTDECCPAQGHPLDVRASRVAAEGVLAGSAPAPSRAELLAEHLAALGPVGGEGSALVAAAVARRELASGTPPGTGAVARTGGDDALAARSVLALWWSLVGHAAAPGPGAVGQDADLTPAQSAELLLGLRDLLVRDALMVSITPTGPRRLGLVGGRGRGSGPAGIHGRRSPRDRRALLDAVTATLGDCSDADHPGDDAVSERAAGVLAALSLTAPRHLRAAPLALLAYVHWWRADTLAAEAAAGAAVAADPEHSLGELVRTLLSQGVAPDWLPTGGRSRGGAAACGPRRVRAVQRRTRTGPPPLAADGDRGDRPAA